MKKAEVYVINKKDNNKEKCTCALCGMGDKFIVESRSHIRCSNCGVGYSTNKETHYFRYKNNEDK